MRAKILFSVFFLVILTVSLFLAVQTILPESVLLFGIVLFGVGSVAVRNPFQGQETSYVFVKLALLGLFFVAEGLLFLALRPFISG